MNGGSVLIAPQALFRFAGEDLPPSLYLASGSEAGSACRPGLPGLGAFSRGSPSCPGILPGRGSFQSCPASPAPPSAPSTPYSGFSEPGKDPGILCFILPRLGILDSFEKKRKQKHEYGLSRPLCAASAGARKHAPGVLGPSERSPGQGWGRPIYQACFRIMGYRAQRGSSAAGWSCAAQGGALLKYRDSLGMTYFNLLLMIPLLQLIVALYAFAFPGHF